jgi:hypothetical protein
MFLLAKVQILKFIVRYYNDHYTDQSVKICKKDLAELSYNLNWHVLCVQEWMHTHRKSRADYNPICSPLSCSLQSLSSSRVRSVLVCTKLMDIFNSQNEPSGVPPFLKKKMC